MATTSINFNNATSLAKMLGSTIGDFANNTAQQAIQGVMGHNANLASAQGQANAANFNANQANMANAQNFMNMANQYQFNSAQAQSANQFTSDMWNRTAEWNEMMWEKQANFNAEQAAIQRQWQEKMANTSYQRAMSDMKDAGLNPILAYSNGGANVPGGATATVGGAQMSSAQGAMASGGLLGANSGSVGGYQGMMEYTAGVMNLLATALGGFATAQQAFSTFGKAGETMMDELTDAITPVREYQNEEGETIKEMNAIGRFAEKMSTVEKIATSPGSTWAEKKSNYYKDLAAITNAKRHFQSKTAEAKYR